MPSPQYSQSGAHLVHNVSRIIQVDDGILGDGVLGVSEVVSDERVSVPDAGGSVEDHHMAGDIDRDGHRLAERVGRAAPVVHETHTWPTHARLVSWCYGIEGITENKYRLSAGRNIRVYWMGDHYQTGKKCAEWSDFRRFGRGLTLDCYAPTQDARSYSSIRYTHKSGSSELGCS